MIILIIIIVIVIVVLLIKHTYVSHVVSDCQYSCGLRETHLLGKHNRNFDVLREEPSGSCISLNPQLAENIMHNHHEFPISSVSIIHVHQDHDETRINDDAHKTTCDKLMVKCIQYLHT
jgi:hypothetical protein